MEYVRALLSLPDDGLDHRFALVVAGQQDHARELAELAGLAAKQMSEAGFSALVGTEGRIRKALADRLEHVRALVAGALEALGVASRPMRTEPMSCARLASNSSPPPNASMPRRRPPRRAGLFLSRWKRPRR